MTAYNKVLLVGNLTKDPDFKYVLDGVPVSNYMLAVNRPYKNAEGTRDADFFRIVCWKKLAEFSQRYLKKGDRVLLEGELQSHSYNKEGKTHFMTEINARKIQFMNYGKKNEDETNESFDTGDLKEDIPF